MNSKNVSTMKKLLLSLLMFVSCNMMFSQNEFEYVAGCAYSDIIDYYDILEMDNGDFVVFGNKSSHDYLGRFSESGELLSEVLRYNYLPGYDSYNFEGDHILKDKNGGFYIFKTYNPILDVNHVNYQGCVDSKIIMEKLDDSFEYVYHKEIQVSIDTTNHLLAGYPPRINIGTILDEGDGFVICYEKYVGHNGYSTHFYGYDSTFFLKTDYNLNILKYGSLEHDECNFLRHRNHLLYDEEDKEYLYYASGNWSDGFRRGLYLYRFDSDFNFIDDHLLARTEGLSNPAIYCRDRAGVVTSGITFKRTSSNTTIMMSGADYHYIPYGHYTVAACVLMDDEAKMLDSVMFAKVESASGYSTSVPSMCSLDWKDENKIFIGATPYAYHAPQLHNSNQYFVIRMIDKNLNTIGEVYYDLGVTTALLTSTLKATNDGGCIIAGYFKDFSKTYKTYNNFIKKFPPEAFVGIEEPHSHGLKLAVAYPNPGGDVLNIRTALRNATLCVYDMQGRKIHEQEITDDITSVDASKWSSGTYIWKLTVNNEQLTVEEGKWIK